MRFSIRLLMAPTGVDLAGPPLTGRRPRDTIPSYSPQTRNPPRPGYEIAIVRKRLPMFSRHAGVFASHCIILGCHPLATITNDQFPTRHRKLHHRRRIIAPGGGLLSVWFFATGVLQFRSHALAARRKASTRNRPLIRPVSLFQNWDTPKRHAHIIPHGGGSRQIENG